MGLRINKIYQDKVGDYTPFNESESGLGLLFPKKYSKFEVRDIWRGAVRYGIELGVFHVSLEGQVIDIYNNVQNPRHKEFADKFFMLVKEYQCGFQHHPLQGLVVVDLKTK